MVVIGAEAGMAARGRVIYEIEHALGIARMENPGAAFGALETMEETHDNMGNKADSAAMK